MINEDAKKFFEKNNIDIHEIRKNTNTHIYNADEINEIVSKYGFQKGKIDKVVSIADVVGYDTEWRNIIPDIYESISSLFDSYGDGYHSRSVSMLEYTPANVIQGLTPSFKSEPMVVEETGEGNYVVSTNGLHRYTVLRALYLSEYDRIKNDPKAVESLKERYKIPVQVREIDEVKTYSKFILREFNDNIRSVEQEVDSNGRKTGNVELRTWDRKETVVSEQELVELAMENIKGIRSQYDTMRFAEYYNNCKGFRRFADEHFKDVLPAEVQKNGIGDDAR